MKGGRVEAGTRITPLKGTIMKKSGLVVIAGLLLMSAAAFAEMGSEQGMECGMDKQGCCGTDKAPMNNMHGKKMGMMNAMKKDLNLTDDQSAQIEAIKSACKTDCQQRSEAIKAARAAKQEAMKQTPPDFATAKAKTQEIDSLLSKNKIAGIEMQEKIFAVLTPEQQQKHAQMMSAGNEKMKGKVMEKKEKMEKKERMSSK